MSVLNVSKDGYGLQCQPIQSIVFAKTHKTASSTLAVILSRYGFERNLSFALPKKDMFIGFKPFVPEMLLAQPQSPGFHILNNHVPFNKSGMAEIMRPEAKYITIIRHPITHFYSVASYFKPQKRHNCTHDITSRDFPSEQCLEKLAKHQGYQAKILYNGQLFSLGFNTTKVLAEYKSVLKAVDQVDTEMDLVLITEYFDESLILLKKLMCWSFEDILYISQKRSGRKYTFSDHIKRRLLSWNFADVILYNHFNKSLWQKIDSYGSPFWEDLQYFQRINFKVNMICVDSKKAFELWLDPDIRSLKLSKNWTEACGNLNVDAYPYTKRLRDLYLATHRISPDY